MTTLTCSLSLPLLPLLPTEGRPVMGGVGRPLPAGQVRGIPVIRWLIGRPVAVHRLAPSEGCLTPAAPPRTGPNGGWRQIRSTCNTKATRGRE